MNHINSNKKTRDFLVLNDIDIWMCEFMITSAQMYRKGAISNTDIKLYEDLITDYRIYLKGGENNKDNMRRKIVDIMTGPLSNTSPVKILRKNIIEVKFGMNGKGSESLNTQEHVDKNSSSSSSSSKPPIEQSSIIDITKILMKIEARQESFFASQVVAEMNERSEYNDVDQYGLNTKICILEKGQRDIKEELNHISKMMLNKASFFDIEFSQWGKKLKAMVARGIKSTLVNVTFSPITFPLYIVSKLYIKPAIAGICRIGKYGYAILVLYTTWSFVGNISYIMLSTDIIPVSNSFPLLSFLKELYITAKNNTTILPSYDEQKNASKLIYNVMSYSSDKLGKVVLSVPKTTKYYISYPTIMTYDLFTNVERPYNGYGLLKNEIKDIFDSEDIAMYYSTAQYYDAKTRHDLCMRYSPLTYMCGDSPVLITNEYKEKEYQRLLNEWTKCKDSYIGSIRGCGEKPDPPQDEKRVKKPVKKHIIYYIKNTISFWFNWFVKDLPKAPKDLKEE